MKALGNSKQKRMTVQQREAAEKIYRASYKKDVMHAEQNTQFFMTIAMLKTLEDYHHFGKKRRHDFMAQFAATANAIGNYLLSNKCTEGDSDIEVYDVPNHHLNDMVEVIEEPPMVITLPDLKEGQNVYVVDKNFGASKIKKLQIQSFTIRHGVLSVHLFAHGFNWAIRPEDLGKTAFLNIYDAQEKAKEV